MWQGKAKEMLRDGLIKSVRIIREPMGTWWNIEFTLTSNKAVLLETARLPHRIKRIKDLNAAISLLEEVGFQINTMDVKS